MDRDHCEEKARKPMEKVPERIGYLPLDTRNSLNPAQQDQRHQRGERDFFDVPRQVAQPGFLNPTLKIRLQDVMHIIIARAVIPRYLCTRYIRSRPPKTGLRMRKRAARTRHWLIAVNATAAAAMLIAFAVP